MTPSEVCDTAGLKGLAELRRMTGQSDQTLINWSRNKPELFEIVAIGAAEKKRQSNMSNVAKQLESLQREAADVKKQADALTYYVDGEYIGERILKIKNKPKHNKLAARLNDIMRSMDALHYI